MSLSGEHRCIVNTMHMSRFDGGFGETPFSFGEQIDVVNC